MERESVSIRSPERRSAGDFPIYRKHSLVHYTVYTRIDQDSRALSITVGRSGKIYSIEFEDSYGCDASPLDYQLGRGAYQSSAEEFQSVFLDLRNALRTSGISPTA